jgi:hypothetical protein
MDRKTLAIFKVYLSGQQLSRTGIYWTGVCECWTVESPVNCYIQITGSNVYMQQIPTSVMELINPHTSAILATRKRGSEDTLIATGSGAVISFRPFSETE